VVGQRKGPSGANAPPVHDIKKYLGKSCALQRYFNFLISQYLIYRVYQKKGDL
jgi:hypothetical protein